MKTQLLAGIIIITGLINRVSAQQTADTSNANLTVYHLGEVVITGSADKETVTREEISKYNTNNAARALNELPSLVFSNSGSRNEGTVYMRGFDLRGVPVYVDGVPVYVPYDGYVDLARFTTAGLSKIEVSKGYSSILYGPNAMGGTINMVSLKPQKKLEIGAKTGIMSGNGYDTYLTLGSKLGKFYFQGLVSKLGRDYTPLSQNADTSTYQPDHKLNNSYNTDSKVSLKAGYTPNETDEYSINYIYQHGEKGNPVYLGNDNSVKIRFWQWPYWDKESVYFISKTRVADKTFLKTRIFYDRFKNQLDSYDDDTYTTQNKKSSFTSLYNDETYGANVEASTQLLRKNDIKMAFHFKNDNHRENNVGEPVRHVADNTASFGLEDVYSPFAALTLIPGVSYNLRRSITAENYDSKNDTITQFLANNNSALNAQVAAYYQITPQLKINADISHKTRFATMKDRYSYKMGIALPNPDLKSEASTNYEIAASLTLAGKITLQPALFYSKLSNTIQSVSNVEPGISQMQNTGNSEFMGGDFTAVYNPLEKLRFYLTYTYIQRHNLSNPDIKFTDVPAHKIFGSVEYKAVKNGTIVVFGEYNSSRYSSSDGNNVAPEYFVLNMQLSYSFYKYLKAEAGMNNIFDKNYCISEGYPEAGRNFYASLYFNLNR
jgi:iron complex outermembrane receptor protein